MTKESDYVVGGMSWLLAVNAWRVAHAGLCGAPLRIVDVMYLL